MPAPELPTLRWGIIGCGLISSWFVADLVLDRPGVATTRHIIQAIGSSSKDKGSAFATKNCPTHSPAIYDSYEGVYNDPNIDIVYIGTPHTLHRRNTIDAITAGKHVLCEKPIAINARDAQEMFDAARDKCVFLMEAVWTRFFPIAQAVPKSLYQDKIIGDVHQVWTHFGLNMPISTAADPQARTASRELGAGALLDIGIYSLTWASVVLDSHPDIMAAPAASPSAKEPLISATMTFASDADPSLHVDEQTTIVLNYPSIKAQAVASCTVLAKGTDEFARISGSKGSITIGGVAASKPGFLVIRRDQPADGEQALERVDFPVAGRGFHFEADAVAQDIRQGRVQNLDTCSWEHTMRIMRRMDQARALCGLEYVQDTS
ncbi:hypothetical protein Micbo1qcDRAFT_211587 [Microdochium bolleyi]|uniref:D-xylose 1-dehydrogenase (NADP(+), D-xylono-1,5-lactone-forming) n=1 Tax=Microdochium bolleyi TaxID=196109 RepID=A0A136JJL8_9PEZI|nr:hypothetical protein Micbo1qcDRAFT_211587 [Microdochium bolleyi]